MPDQAKINFYPFSDGAALHRVGTHKIWVLNHSSAVLWCLYEEYGEGEDLVRAYAEHFRLSLQRAQEDIGSALQGFADNGVTGGVARGAWRVARKPVVSDQGLETSDQLPKTGDQLLVTCDLGETRKQGPETSHLAQSTSHFVQAYLLAGVSWQISCDDVVSAETWFGCLKHLEVERVSPGIHYSVARDKDGWSVRSENDEVVKLIDDQVLPCLLTSLFGHLCRSLSQHLLLHAAVAVKGDRAVLFPGESAFGKSTLSSALAAHGWTLFSDELAPLDTGSMCVAPFVFPVGVKSRSLPVLKAYCPDLDDLPAYQRLDGQVVRYLSGPDICLADPSTPPMEVTALVFPRYVPGQVTHLEKLSPLQALELLANSGSSERPLDVEDVKALLELAEGRPCWSLTYSDLGEAVEMVGQEIKRV